MAEEAGVDDDGEPPLLRPEDMTDMPSNLRLRLRLKGRH